MDPTVATMDLTGRNQRPGTGEIGRPTQHSLGGPLAELPSISREQTFPSSYSDSPHPLPLARLQNEPFLQSHKPGCPTPQGKDGKTKS